MIPILDTIYFCSPFSHSKNNFFSFRKVRKSVLLTESNGNSWSAPTSVQKSERWDKNRQQDASYFIPDENVMFYLL